MRRLTVAVVVVAGLWLVLILSAANATAPCPRTDRAAWRIYDQAVRTHTVSVQDRDRVRLAVVRDWLACR